MSKAGIDERWALVVYQGPVGTVTEAPEPITGLTEQGPLQLTAPRRTVVSGPTSLRASGRIPEEGSTL